ncbi:uncharacterized protein LOC144358485 [Saccoglossus kowalevskii]
MSLLNFTAPDGTVFGLRHMVIYPTVLLALRTAHAQFLLQCGDVEENPGPLPSAETQLDYITKIITSRDILVSSIVIDGYILNYLVQQGALDISEYNRIHVPGSPEPDEVKRLLDVLITKDKRAYDVFVTSLQQPYPVIAQMMNIPNRPEMPNLSNQNKSQNLNAYCDDETIAIGNKSSEDDTDDVVDKYFDDPEQKVQKKKSFSNYVYNFKRLFFGSSTGAAAPNPQIVEDCKADLKQLYVKMCTWRRPAPWYASQLGFPCTDFKVYRLVQSPSESESTSKIKIKITIDEIFASHETCKDPKHVIVYEDTDAYSPVLCIKLAYDWAINNPDCPIKNKIPFLVDGSRPCGNAMTVLFDFMHRKFQWNLAKLHELWDYITHHPRDFMFLVYGLKDEEKRPQRKLTKKLCKDKEVKNCYILLCCQLVATNVRANLIKANDSELLVSKLCIEQHKEYIARHFKNKEEVNHLSAIIANDDRLIEFCKTSLNILLICTLWKEMKNIPNKPADFYKAIILCMMRRASRMKNIDMTATNIKDIPPAYNKCLLTVGKMCFISKNNIQLTKKMVRDIFGDFLVLEIGLLRQQTEILGSEHEVEFELFDSEFGNFLAAYYLSDLMMNADQVNDILVKLLSSNRHAVVEYTVALMEKSAKHFFTKLVQHLGNRVVSFHAEDTIIKLYFRCLCECSNPKTFSKLVAPVIPKNLVVADWHPSEVNGLVYVLHEQKCNLSNIRIGLVKGTMWESNKGTVSGLFRALHVNKSIHSLCIKIDPVFKDHFEMFCDMLKTNKSITKLQLCIVSTDLILPSLMTCLCDGLRASSIAVLDIYLKGIAPSRISLLAEALKSMDKLRDFACLLDVHERHYGEMLRLLCSCGLQQVRQLESLDLSMCSFGEPPGIPRDPSTVIALATTIQNAEFLRKLTLQGCMICDVGAETMADAFRGNKSLEEVNISNNYFGPKAVKVLCDALNGKPKLKRLQISYYIPLDHGGTSGLGSLIKCSPSLEYLDLRPVDIMLKEASLTSKHMNLRERAIENSRDAEDIAMAFSKNKTLKEFYIGQAFKDNLLTTLVSGLCKSKSIPTLDISRCGLSDKMGMELMMATYQCESLSAMNLSYNSLTVTAINALLIAANGMPNLVDIDISHNKIKSVGANNIIVALKKMTKLKRLNMMDNGISADGLVNLPNNLPTHSNLQYLNLSYNHIGNIGAKMILGSLKTNTALQELDIRQCKLTGQTLADFSRMINDNTNVTLKYVLLYPGEFSVLLVDEVISTIERCNSTLVKVRLSPDILELQNKEWATYCKFEKPLEHHILTQRWVLDDDIRGQVGKNDLPRSVYSSIYGEASDQSQGGLIHCQDGDNNVSNKDYQEDDQEFENSDSKYLSNSHDANEQIHDYAQLYHGYQE